MPNNWICNDSWCLKFMFWWFHLNPRVRKAFGKKSKLLEDFMLNLVLTPETVFCSRNWILSPHSIIFIINFFRAGLQFWQIRVILFNIDSFWNFLQTWARYKKFENHIILISILTLHSKSIEYSSMKGLCYQKVPANLLELRHIELMHFLLLQVPNSMHAEKGLHDSW